MNSPHTSQPKKVQYVKEEASSFGGLIQTQPRLTRPGASAVKDQAEPAAWSKILGGLIGIVLFCLIVVGLFRAAVWIYEQIPESEYKKAMTVANNLQCQLPPGVAEHQESRLYKNFMDDNVFKIKAYADQHHRGMWQFRVTLEEEVATQAKQFNDACAHYQRINQNFSAGKGAK